MYYLSILLFFYGYIYVSGKNGKLWMYEPTTDHPIS